MSLWVKVLPFLSFPRLLSPLIGGRLSADCRSRRWRSFPAYSGIAVKDLLEVVIPARTSSPADLGKYLAAEIETYRQVIAENGIKIQ